MNDDSAMMDATLAESVMPTDDVLRNGAKAFELFWLRPSKLAGSEQTVRLRINRKLGGWKLKDGLVESVGLRVGDTVSTEVSVLMGPGIIDDDADTDLFADGEAADWLVDVVLNAGEAKGCIIDGRVRFMYESAPVLANDRSVRKVSLVLLEGLRFIKLEKDDQSMAMPNVPFSAILEQLIQS